MSNLSYFSWLNCGFSDEFSSNNNNKSSSDSKLLLWAIKSEFRTSFSRSIDNRKDQRSKIPVGKYKQNIPVCVAERVLLNIKISRQKRRCRSRSPRQFDVRDDKNVCCLSSLIIYISWQSLLRNRNIFLAYLYNQFSRAFREGLFGSSPFSTRRLKERTIQKCKMIFNSFFKGESNA